MIWDKEASDDTAQQEARRLASPAPMHASPPRSTLLRPMAWLTLVLLLAVTCLSAYLRHSASGLGCTPWPACFGQGQGAAAGAIVVAGQALTLARAAHRVTATLALLLIVAMVIACAVARPRLLREGALSLALLVIALTLAVLGVFTPGSRLPAVAIGNLLGGFAMLAIAARLPAPSTHKGLGIVAIGVALLLVLQTVGGVFVSATLAGLACIDIRECAAQARTAGWDWRALDPWRVASFSVGAAHGDGALALLLHRGSSIVLTLVLAAFAAVVMRHGQRHAGWLLMGLLALQVALGLAIGSTGLPLVPVLLHNLATALLLAIVVRLA